MGRRFEREIAEDFRKATDLDRISTRSKKQLGNSIIALMLASIKKGISPITGRRFRGYKNPDRYPGRLKRPRPVNLKLTGKFLKSLSARVSRDEIILFFRGRKSNLIEEGHRKGANSQRKRPILPQGEETFSRSIRLAIDKKLQQIIDKTFR